MWEIWTEGMQPYYGCTHHEILEMIRTRQLLAQPDDAKNPRLSLLLAGDELKGLPPATIILAQIDPLRSGGEALAKALQDAGVKVNLKSYDGVTHEFFGMGAVVDKAREALMTSAADLKAAFNHETASR